MKNIAYLFFLLFFYSGTQAQLHDKIWFTGKWSNVPPDTVFGNVRFTFSDTGVAIKRDSLGMNFDRGSSTISDSAGNLLFYTNGIDIRNANDEIMENGDSLGKGWLLAYYGFYSSGLRMPKLHAVFPVNDSSFYMVYLFGDSIYIPKAYDSKILLALIEPYANNGKGRVVFKDSVLLSDTLGGQLAVTKDADAKGWWMVGQIAKTNCYPVLYVDSTGKVEYKQRYCGGGSNTGYEFAAMDFTKDGSKLVVAGSHYSNGRVNVFDFNRCTGELSIIETFSHPTIRDSTRIVQGIESSPNSRYMYLFAGLSIIQLDLAAPSIANSAQTVAYMDTFAGETAVTFFSGQLGIDGRIYVCGGSGYKYVHRINQPDRGGLACEVQQCYHRMPAFILGLPRYPNYRLGAANCTGVGINEAAINKVRMGLYPNPASSTLQVEYNYINWEQSGSIQLTLTDATGRSIHSQALPMYSALQNIDVSQLASGVYFVSLSAKERTIANGRFVKE